MKADATTCIASATSPLSCTDNFPAMQMFLVEKKLLIIDQRNVAPPGGKMQSGGEEAAAALNEKSKMNYASL